jgi:hypothetical protein
MSKSIQIVDILKASTGNAPIVAQDKIAYNVSRTLDQFDDTDLITKEAAVEASGNSTIEVPVISAGTTIPFFVDASLYTGANVNSDVIVKATSYDPVTGDPTGRLQRWYDIPIEDQDTNDDGSGDFTGWNIFGHDDGTGKFKEDTFVIIKG